MEKFYTKFHEIKDNRSLKLNEVTQLFGKLAKYNLFQVIAHQLKMSSSSPKIMNN